MPHVENLNTLIGLIRENQAVQFHVLVNDLIDEAERMYLQLANVRSELATAQHRIEELEAELARMRMLYEAASYNVGVERSIAETAEHEVQHLRSIVEES